MRRVMAQISRVAASQTRVCIYGETGTGKELVARTLHQASPRADGPFITLNCAAIPAELIESELFGHEKGSFTGAAQRYTGKFEQAHRGTLFLDEIGDMPLTMQAKLLRVLEEGEVERIGGSKSIPVDVRILVATHRDLEGLVREGTFRQDLFHRVHVFPIVLPPLRDRKEDIPPLIEHFARQVCAQNGWKAVTVYPGCELRGCGSMRGRGISASCATWWSAYYCWPPMRWIESVVDLALPAAPDRSRRSDLNGQTGLLAERVASFEKETILAELERNHRHITNTAKALGLERSYLYKKCQQLGIDLRKI